MSTAKPMTSPNKEVSEILRTARGLGWTAAKDAKHWKLIPPGGFTDENRSALICANTPGTSRWKANFLADARRYSGAGKVLADTIEGRARPQPKTNGGPAYIEAAPTAAEIDHELAKAHERERSGAELPDTDAVLGGPTVDIETITPAIAQKMLDSMFDGQRKVVRNSLEMYRQDFRSGDFVLNGDAIMIDTEGKTLNGQHRLLACVSTGVPFTAVVMRGMPTDAYKVIDKGAKRSLATTLHAMNIPYEKVVAGALRLLSVYMHNGRMVSRGLKGSSGTEAQLLGLLDRNPGLINAAGASYPVYSKLHWSQSGSAVLYYLFETVDGVAGPSFFATLADGMSAWDDAQRDPAMHLRAVLIGRLALSVDRRPDDEYYAALAIKAWNFYLKRKPVKNLGYRATESFPTIYDPKSRLLQVLTGPQEDQ